MPSPAASSSSPCIPYRFHKEPTTIHEGPLTGTTVAAYLLPFRRSAPGRDSMFSGDCVAPPRSSLFTFVIYCSRSLRVLILILTSESLKIHTKKPAISFKRRQAVNLRGTTLVDITDQPNLCHPKISTLQPSKIIRPHNNSARLTRPPSHGGNP